MTTTTKELIKDSGGGDCDDGGGGAVPKTRAVRTWRSFNVSYLAQEHASGPLEALLQGGRPLGRYEITLAPAAIAAIETAVTGRESKVGRQHLQHEKKRKKRRRRKSS